MHQVAELRNNLISSTILITKLWDVKVFCELFASGHRQYDEMLQAIGFIRSRGNVMHLNLFLLPSYGGVIIVGEVMLPEVGGCEDGFGSLWVYGQLRSQRHESRLGHTLKAVMRDCSSS